MKERLISDDDVRKFHPIFRGKNGDKYIKWGMKMSCLVNSCELYDKSKHLTGDAFTTDLLDKLEQKRTVLNDPLEQLKISRLSCLPIIPTATLTDCAY